MKFVLVLLFAVLFYSSSAEAYVGPGMGVGALGVIVGIVVSVLMAIVGIFWYPIKRLFKKKDDSESLEETDVQEAVAEESTINDGSEKAEEKQ